MNPGVDCPCLAAFAISARRRPITFDAGFRQYSRLDFLVPDH
jgi:hypothetical protein